MQSDPESRPRRRTVQAGAIGLAALVLVLLATRESDTRGAGEAPLWVYVLIFGLAGAAYWLARARREFAGSVVLALTPLVGIVILIAVRGQIGHTYFFAPVSLFAAAATLKPRAVWLVLFGSLAVVAAGWRLTAGVPQVFAPPEFILYRNALTLIALCGIVGVATAYNVQRAVSEARRNEAEARAAEGRYDFTARHMSDVVALLDESRCWRFVTPSAERVLGVAPASMLGARYAELFHPDDLPTIDALLAAAETLSATPTTVRARHRDGDWRWLDVQFDRVPHAEERRISMVARDVTARRALEQEVRKAEQMAAMGALLAHVAHDVRNPLFGISAIIDAMEARGLGGDPNTGKLIKMMRASVDQLNKLMKDLLEYSRPAPAKLLRVPVASVVAAAVRACAPLADRSGVRIDNAVLDAGSAMLDADRFAQVLQNLVENAVQHSPAGAEVRIEAKENSAPGMLELRVLDRGKGFEPADLPHLFEPFFTRRPGGTGLGLSIVQRIVEQHGGSIEARNRAGGGAETIVHLPRQPLAPAPALASAGAAPAAIIPRVES